MEKTRCLVFDDASHQVCRRQCGTLRSIVEDCIANEPLVALMWYDYWTLEKSIHLSLYYGRLSKGTAVANVHSLKPYPTARDTGW